MSVLNACINTGVQQPFLYALGDMSYTDRVVLKAVVSVTQPLQEDYLSLLSYKIP